MRSRADVFAFCRAERDSTAHQWKGMCLSFTRQAFGLPARYPSASSAWHNAKMKHPANAGSSIPQCVPVFWLGGARGFGHIAVSVGGGLCWTTDFRRHGDVDLVRIDDITRAWGQDLVGWSEDLNGFRVWEKPGSQTPRIDRIVELARDAKRATANPEKDADMDRILHIATKWSAKY